MEIKLIATDMDGTFLNDDKQVLPENLKALEECAAQGIEIVPATGRIVAGIPKEIKNLPGVRYAISVNGAVVVDLEQGKEISTCRIANDLAVRVMEIARDSEADIMFDAYVDGIGYTNHDFYANVEKYVPLRGVVELIRRTRRPVENHVAHVKTCGKEVDKINMFFASMEDRQRMRAELEKIPKLLVSSSLPNNLEINAMGADKGSALLRLANHLGIGRTETMAFGDGENDLSMIECAGFGVAMENGEEVVKAAADYITITNNEAGVAKAIRQFVLKQGV